MSCVTTLNLDTFGQSIVVHAISLNVGRDQALHPPAASSGKTW